ncbi:helix-turn-helix domain-containing protein [Streptomyces sp. NPDC048002]|uniref:helix-turn-helix domain-containing protein n=1 Tax=unclassified Streptomyces TaxID=2593676 RepID=UPI0033D24BB0
MPTREREEIIRHALWGSFSRVDIDHHAPPGKISGRMRLSALGPIRFCSAKATPVTFRRTERLARQDDDEPAVFVGLQLRGTNLVTQHGRQALVPPGHLVVHESNAPYTLHFAAGVDYCAFRVPRAALAVPGRVLRDIAAIPLGPDNAVARLAFTYFAQLAVSEELHDVAESSTIVDPSLELLRAVMTSRPGASGHVRAAPAEVPLSLRITQYARAHLADPGLSAARIAAAHGISVRHLYSVLAEAGISLGAWIRAHRLAECRRELAGPNGRLRTVAGIGRSWGFVDATHFSKVFKEAYGLSPRAWREQHHRARTELPSR